jgi:deoxyribose-phosphate aldolase
VEHNSSIPERPKFEVKHISASSVRIQAGNPSFNRYTSLDNNERNPGIPLDMSWVNAARVNKSATQRRAAEIGTRRSVKKKFQSAWLLNAIRVTDLTTLSGDDTQGKVQRLCGKARHPVRQDILEALSIQEPITTGAVCVYPAQVSAAVEALKGSGIPVASVATGFPSGQIKHEHKLEEIEQCVRDGATEIDIVINRDAALSGDWDRVYRETQDFREACGDAHMKAILATGELATLTNVYKASLVCMMAGSDFIKTSTGKEPENATLPVSLIMLRAIREYLLRTDGYKIGFKPAGGIASAKQALQYQALMKEELGDEWLSPHLFRLGASSLVIDIERQLFHQATGSYANKSYMPMS